MRNKAGRLVIYFFVGLLVTEGMLGCRTSSKKCGCGSDLMANYKRGKFRRR